MLPKIVLFLLLCLPASEALAEKTVTMTGGGWSRSIGSGDLSAGPGSDLQSSYTSTMPVLISVSGCIDDSDGWRIDVRRVAGSWDGNLNLSVYRTADGSGSGSINGGTGEILTSVGDTPFFSGSGNRADIPVLVKLSGLSVQLPPGSYGSTIVYTVVDLP